MDIPLEVKGFEGRGLKLEAKKFGGERLSIDGNPLKPVKGKIVVKNNQGQDIEIKLKKNPVLFEVEQIEINGQLIRVKAPLTWYQYAWGGFPILLVAIGGAVGGGLGGGASYINLHILRSKMNGFLKYLVTALISLAAILLWLVIAAAVQGALSSPK